jgi:hypothetical protein
LVLPANAGDTLIVLSTKGTCFVYDSLAVEKWYDGTTTPVSSSVSSVSSSVSPTVSSGSRGQPFHVSLSLLLGLLMPSRPITALRTA